MSQTDYDLVIIGAGPGGLTAALYAARARLSVLMLEKVAPGGQILVTDWIENYPGFPEGISGPDLMERMLDQVRRFDVEIQSGEVVSMDLDGPVKTLYLTDKHVTARAVIIASGSSPQSLGVPGENRYIGRGVSTCATCDAPFFKDAVVAAVGGGDTAVQESLFLTRFVRKVYLVHRRDELRAVKVLQERARDNEKIEILWDSTVEEIKGGEAGVNAVAIRNLKTGDISDRAVEGCFIWVGTIPNTGFIKGQVDLDEQGFIITDDRRRTNKPGVFAVGDVRNTPLRQVVTAAGDGAVAANEVMLYLENL